MQIVVYNYTYSQLARDAENMVIRAAYICGGDVMMAGISWENIYLETYFKKASLKEKIGVLNQYYKDEDPEWKESIEQYMTITKATNKIKYKPPQLLIAEKKIQKSLEKEFDGWIEDMKKIPDLKIFHDLGILCKDDVFDFYPISEEPENEQDTAVVASDLFLRTLPSFEEDKGIFFLPIDFFL
jgi:hypothetical protein